MKTNYITTSALLILCIIQTLIAQTTPEWVQRFNGAGNEDDQAYAMVTDAVGNIYVTGKTMGSVTQNDYITIKYNSSGIQQWAKTYDGPGHSQDFPYSIKVDASGNVYVTGRSFNISLNYDYATIKYNSSGVQQWAVRYNGAANEDDKANAIAVDGSGNVYVTGSSKGTGTNFDFATIKYNSMGVLLWVKRYNGPDNLIDEANSIEIDGSGNVYVTGSTWNLATSNDYLTIKYNSSGVLQWYKTYNGSANSSDIAYSIAVDVAGSVIITGASSGSGTNQDYCTVKYSPSGVLNWVRRWDDASHNNDISVRLVLDASGNVYVTGWSSGTGTYDFTTIKYNSLGTQQWVQSYDAGGDDFSASIAVDISGNVYVTGGSAEGITSDIVTIKYNSSGAQEWIDRYNGPDNGFDLSYAIALDATGNIYVAGATDMAASRFDILLIKYSAPIGIKSLSGEIPDKFNLHQNYPNPFNPETNIKFQISASSHVKLAVYNALGEEVAILTDGILNAGTYQVKWNAINNPSGTYFYNLTAGDYNETKKMILIK